MGGTNGAARRACYVSKRSISTRSSMGEELLERPAATKLCGLILRRAVRREAATFVAGDTLLVPAMDLCERGHNLLLG